MTSVSLFPQHWYFDAGSAVALFSAILFVVDDCKRETHGRPTHEVERLLRSSLVHASDAAVCSPYGTLRLCLRLKDVCVTQPIEDSCFLDFQFMFDDAILVLCVCL